MKFKFGLNLPWGIYVSILTLLTIATYIWNNVDSTDTKDLIKYICFILILSIIQGALLIRMGKFEIYKNILNALWNIETAATFLYGMYLILLYSKAPSHMELPFSQWSSENIELFISIIILLSVICVARAGYSIAEIFKAPILKTLPIGAKASELNLSKKTIKQKNHSAKRRKNKIIQPANASKCHG